MSARRGLSAPAGARAPYVIWTAESPVWVGQGRLRPRGRLLRAQLRRGGHESAGAPDAARRPERGGVGAGREPVRPPRARSESRD